MMEFDCGNTEHLVTGNVDSDTQIGIVLSIFFLQSCPLQLYYFIILFIDRCDQTLLLRRISGSVYRLFHGAGDAALAGVKLASNGAILREGAADGFACFRNSQRVFSDINDITGMLIIPIWPTLPSGLNCFPMAPSEEMTLGFAGLVSFFWPTASAASWMGFWDDMALALGTEAVKSLVCLRAILFIVM